MNRLATVATLFLITGCIAHGGQKWFDESGRQEVLNRASFDLSCPKEQINMMPIGAAEYPYTTIGANGCGARTTYVWKAYQGWSRNSEVLGAVHPSAAK
jgi:hypothetical protein